MQAPDDSPPDVWMQLLELCATDPAAQPAVTSCMLQQLQHQQAHCERQAAQLEAVSLEAAELHGQLQASDSRVQVLERQMQEVLAALRRRE